MFIVGEKIVCYLPLNMISHCWRQTLSALKLKTRVRTSATHAQLATSDFQTEVIVEMIATHRYICYSHDSKQGMNVFELAAVG